MVALDERLTGAALLGGFNLARKITVCEHHRLRRGGGGCDRSALKTDTRAVDELGPIMRRHQLDRRDIVVPALAQGIVCSFFCYVECVLEAEAAGGQRVQQYSPNVNRESVHRVRTGVEAHIDQLAN